MTTWKGISWNLVMVHNLWTKSTENFHFDMKWNLNSHVTKRAHPPRYRLALECQNLLYHILCISFIVSNNPRVFLYIWNHQICSQYQGFVTRFRFTADEKFYPRIFFISASNAPLNFSKGPLKHFWQSRSASARKMHFRGFWHWSAKR